jgi:hypothetical protein
MAALLATVLSALTIELLSAFATRGGDSAPGVVDIVKATLLLCTITVVSCGSFGFLAGLAGAGAIYLRRRRIRTVWRLLIEAALAGLLMGCLFPLFDAALNSPSLQSFKSWLNPAQIMFCVPVSITCALFCGLAFRRHFVHPSTVAPV